MSVLSGGWGIEHGPDGTGRADLSTGSGARGASCLCTHYIIMWESTSSVKKLPEGEAFRLGLFLKPLRGLLLKCTFTEM